MGTANPRPGKHSVRIRPKDTDTQLTGDMPNCILRPHAVAVLVQTRREGRNGELFADDPKLDEKLAALKQRQARKQAQLKQLQDSGETQRSRTDPDARSLSKGKQHTVGYNVQSTVDDKHKLQQLNAALVASDLFKTFTAAQMEYVDLMRKVNQALRDELAAIEG